MFPNLNAVRSEHIVLQITDIGCRRNLTDVLIRINCNRTEQNGTDWTAIELNRK
jgi:hypothetical protein